MTTVSPADRSYRLWLAAAVALALALRLINIGAQPFWGDEIVSLSIAHHFLGAPGQLIQYLKEVETHPALYYLLLQAWIPVFGLGTAAVRFPSVAFSLVGVVAAAWLARTLFDDRRTAVIAAFAVALLPMQIEFAQSARPYAIMCFLGTISVGACWKFLRTGRKRWALAYAAAGALGLNLHYSYVCILVPLGLWWAYETLASAGPRRRELFFAGLYAHAAIFLAFAWWLDTVLYKILNGRLQVSGLPARFDADGRDATFSEGLLNGLIWTSKALKLPTAEIAAQTLAKGFLAAGAVLAAKSPRLEPGEGKPWSFLCWIGAGSLAFFALLPTSFSYTPLLQQHLIFLSVLAAVAIARLLALLPARHAAVLAALLCITLAPRIVDILGNDASWDRHYRIESDAAIINAQARPGDVIVIGYTTSRTALNHYLRPDLEAVGFLPIAFGGHDDWFSRETLGFYECEFVLRIEAPSLPDATAKLRRIASAPGVRRVWLYEMPSAVEEAAPGIFADMGWRTVMTPLGDLSPLALYAKK